MTLPLNCAGTVDYHVEFEAPCSELDMPRILGRIRDAIFGIDQSLRVDFALGAQSHSDYNCVINSEIDGSNSLLTSDQIADQAANVQIEADSTIRRGSLFTAIINAAETTYECSSLVSNLRLLCC